MGWGQGRGNSRKKPTEAVGSIAGLSHRGLFAIGLILSGFGLLMIYSSSAVMGLQRYGDALYYLKKQAVFVGAGWLLYFAVAQIPFIRLARLRVPTLIACFALLAVVLIPGIGHTAGGAQRWISLGIGNFQPAELARLLLVFYVAATLAVRADRLDSFNKGFLPLLVVTGLTMFLLVLQPDFGSAMSVFALSVALWFVGRVPIPYIAGIFVLALPAVALLIFRAGYRAKRVMTFLDPWADPQGSGFQVIQSFMGFTNGGWTGLGLGNSQQKLYYLPEAHTDFIFSVIGEELGVAGVIGVVFLFLLLLSMGAKITRMQMSNFGYYLAAGVCLFICLPALLNMMVTMGLLPTKGLPLPFFSSGGSSLLVSLVALGILQSLHARCDEDPNL